MFILVYLLNIFIEYTIYFALLRKSITPACVLLPGYSVVVEPSTIRIVGNPLILYLPTSSLSLSASSIFTSTLVPSSNVIGEASTSF